MEQFSLAWLLSQPAVTASIVGTTAEKHIIEAVEALDITLSEEEITS
nr:aldo/keto reductase [Rosenbergiella epipactidis]